MDDGDTAGTSLSGVTPSSSAPPSPGSGLDGTVDGTVRASDGAASAAPVASLSATGASHRPLNAASPAAPSGAADTATGVTPAAVGDAATSISTRPGSGNDTAGGGDTGSASIGAAGTPPRTSAGAPVTGVTCTGAGSPPAPAATGTGTAVSSSAATSTTTTPAPTRTPPRRRPPTMDRLHQIALPATDRRCNHHPPATDKHTRDQRHTTFAMNGFRDNDAASRADSAGRSVGGSLSGLSGGCPQRSRSCSSPFSRAFAARSTARGRCRR